MRSGRTLLACAALLLLGATSSPTSLPAPAIIRPSQLSVGAEWEGSQYLGVDAKGKLYLLNPAALEVSPLLASGRLGKPLRLGPSGTVPPAMVLGAAMGRSADEWLLLEGAEHIRWFAGGRELPLPALGWLGTAVQLVKGTPMVATLPAEAGGAPAGILDSADPPVILALQGSQWQPLLREPFAPAPHEAGNPGMTLHGYGTVHLATDSRGRLWLANMYFYRVRELSPAGRVLLTLTAGEPKPQVRDRSTAEVEQLRRIAVDQGFLPEKLKLSKQGLAKAVDALVEGRDGRMYFLTTRGVKAPASHALERYDPVELKHERMLLAVDFGSAGKLLMASASEGLYLAAMARPGELFRLTWEELDAAKWQPVEGVEVDSGAAATGERAGAYP